MFKLTAAAALVASTAALTPNSIEAQFESFMTTFNKSYPSASEKAARFAIFIENVARIQRLNLEYPSNHFAVNQFADLTDAERNDVNMMGFKAGLQSNISITMGDIPTEVDFTGLPESLNYDECYPAIRDQGRCGSCWAFATTSSVEGAHCKANNNTPIAAGAPQTLVDCDHAQAGCNGASELTEPFDFVQRNGLCYEKDYPYTARDESCKLNTCEDKIYVDGFKDLARNSGATTQTIIEGLNKYGPLSVAVGVSFGFQMYNGGVLSKAACGREQLNHAVVVTGYETGADGKVAFKILNSWGQAWGENGYIRIEAGACGLGGMVVGAIVEASEESLRM